MSRIGNQPIPVPAKVEVTLAPGAITVKGPLGTLTRYSGTDAVLGLIAHGPPAGLPFVPPGPD